MPSPIELLTPRLRLRQWIDTDRDAFAAMSADPRVMEYLLPFADRAAVEAWIDRARTRIAQTGWGFWAVELRDSPGTFIGVTGLLSQPDRFAFSPCVEIGWRFSSAHWGQGYATEAATAALDFGFNTLALPEIVAFTAVINRRSQAVMKRLGMTIHALTPRFDHPSVPAGNPLREHYLYNISAAQWASRHVTKM